MRPRAWRITMWTSLAATVLLAGGAIGSRGWRWRWADAQGRWVGLVDGRMAWGSNKTLKKPGWRSSRESVLRSPWWWYEDLLPMGWGMGVSLWLPAGGTFAVSALSAFNVYRTRRRPGYCPCGYDRSGLPTDAPCPECGKERMT